MTNSKFSEKPVEALLVFSGGNRDHPHSLGKSEVGGPFNPGLRQTGTWEHDRNKAMVRMARGLRVFLVFNYATRSPLPSE